MNENNVTREEMEAAVRTILEAIGEDPEREGLAGTPERVCRMFAELSTGYAKDLEAVVNGAVFHETASGMVLVKDISYYSLCEHHMMPFFGRVDIAYIPDGRIIGLSKIPRIVEMYARRLQLQERLTDQIVGALETVIEPKGIAIRMEGKHLCAAMRGVKKEEASLVTQRFTGVFETSADLRGEFFRQLCEPGGKIP